MTHKLAKILKPDKRDKVDFTSYKDDPRTEVIVLRGHHLYQLYKAYQLKHRGALKIWDYFAMNFLAGVPYIPDKAFGDKPEKIQHIKKTLNTLLGNPDLKISFTDARIKDSLCKNCPTELCSFSEEHSDQDEYILKLTELETKKSYSLEDLSRLFSKGKDNWASTYEYEFGRVSRFPFYFWKDSIMAIRHN